MKHFLFVESNTTGSGRVAVERLQRQRDRVTFLSREPGKYPFLADGSPWLSVVTGETNDVESVVRQVAEIHRRHPIDALLTFSDYYVAIVAEAAARLGFRYLAPAAARACRDKYETRRALQRAGLPVPAFRVVSSLEEAWSASQEVAYPCVVKPVTESSSRGVLQVHDAAELIGQFREIHGWRENARRQPLEGRVLVESLLAGPEYSVETVTLAPGRTRVVGITTKHLSVPPLFVELGHDFPSRIDGAQAALLEQAVVAALDALGYDFGPAHTEVRLTPAGPVIVEINPRLAGGMIPELVHNALGIDLVGVLFALLTGEPAGLAPTRAEWSSIRFLTASRRGRLTAVGGIEAASRLATVREVTVARRVGDEVQPAAEATHRLGHVITSGPDPRRVIAEADAALACLTPVIEPVALTAGEVA